jgi:hypothetical protein
LDGIASLGKSDIRHQEDIILALASHQGRQRFEMAGAGGREPGLGHFERLKESLVDADLTPEKLVNSIFLDRINRSSARSFIRLSTSPVSRSWRAEICSETEEFLAPRRFKLSGTRAGPLRLGLHQKDVAGEIICTVGTITNSELTEPSQNSNSCAPDH